MSTLKENSGKKRPRKKTALAFIRFFAESKVDSDIEELHNKISTRRYSGATTERLVRAALAMVNDPNDPPAVPPDIVEMRQRLGRKTTNAAADGEVVKMIEVQGRELKALLRKVEALEKRKK